MAKIAKVVKVPEKCAVFGGAYTLYRNKYSTGTSCCLKYFFEKFLAANISYKYIIISSQR